MFNIGSFRFVTAVFVAIAIFQIELVEAQKRCPMHSHGPLGPVLKVNIVVDKCTYDNSTSTPTLVCQPWIQKDFRRGEYLDLSWKMSWIVTAKFYGREV